jgi:tetratricopeptide (TPR) repeat protein
MTALTEAGLLALSGMLLLFVSLYRQAKKDFKEKKIVNWGFAAIASMISLLALTLGLLFFPATILLIVLLFILLSLNAKIRHTTLSLTTQGVETSQGLSSQNVASRFPALLITVPVIIFVILFLVQATQVLRAEYKFKKALDLLATNNASETYDTMREAIRLNPRVDRYHATFARVNLALANAITLKVASQTQQGQEGETQEQTSVSEQDRQNITLLIQQAISEGKASVALNPLRSGNWEVLAQIYRTIMPLAQGADSFAVQTYRQAIALDPFNPNLRISLGGIHYGLRDYDGAIRVFESAVAAKNDHANAHYNLAFALRDKGELDRALSEMSLVVSLITDKNSEDYKAAQQALQDLQAKRQAAAPAGQELTPPQEAEEPVLQPQLDLPEGSEPPNAPITPTVTPTPSVSEEVSLTPTPTPGQ